MIEVLAATLVLAIGLGAVFQMLIAAAHVTGTDRVRQLETSVARELTEDTRSLDYAQLTPTGIASALQSMVSGTTASGSTLTVTRTNPSGSGSVYTFKATFTACSMDDPSLGLGNYSQPPASGGTWCTDNAASGTTNATPDDYKRVSVVVAPTGSRTTPTVQQTVLVYNKGNHGPAVTCLSVSSSCPGSNQTYTSGTQLTFNVTTTTPAASIKWLVNGSLPTSGQLSSGEIDPYTPSTTSSTFNWVFPQADGTYTISAIASDVNGNTGTLQSIQITLNRHQAIPPSSVTAGWNKQISGVDVQWVPSIDQDVLSYDVYAQYGTNSAVLVCANVKGTSCYDLTARSPGTEPTCQSPPQSFTTSNKYWVVGVDTDPSTGGQRVSTSQSPQVDANLCDNPPYAPTGLSGTVSNGQMRLSWTAPSPQDPDTGDSIEFWRIYRWTGTGPTFPGNRYDLVGALGSSGSQVTSYTDNSADPSGNAQNYCVTAVDTHLNESPCSNVVTG